MRRRCDSDKCALSTDKLQSILPSIFLSFIVAAQRGNNIFAVLSSPRSAETIFLPFYRRRAARKRYFCLFIVAVQRGNDIFAFLSSPRRAGTIFLPFYRHRATRERYFAVLSSPCSVPANASATPLKRGQIIRPSGRQTGRRC
ncbi:hypothetical protein HMPREF9431_01216 [Segatella oulorum F0390]|uniref:Uncharacterized protein n=1 Tax=Segatella oulorum F0390 TaxID=702438 RepID=G1WBL5_9BACT|nr:hypothetical protein HMPREF9431_01216 [Segatella oulorum F0390]